MSKSKKESNAMVVRVHKTKGYTIMSNDHLFSKPPLSLKAKGLLSMFLAFPENWKYSIPGITSVCKESIDCIKATLHELKNSGYLKIEKLMPNKSKSGRIEYVYHIYETRQKIKKQEVEKPPLEQEVEKQALENQAFENQELEKQTFENTPLYIITNNTNTNNQITNEINTCENVNIFTATDLFNIYKNICTSFPQPRELTTDRKLKACKRIKKQPLREFWETVCKKAEASDFCKNSNFFTFNWIIANDENSLKVYEGNYDNKNNKPSGGKNSPVKYDGFVENFIPVSKIKAEKEAKEQEKLKKAYEEIRTKEQALNFICARFFTIMGNPKIEDEFWDRPWVIELKETYGIMKKDCYKKMDIKREDDEFKSFEEVES